MRKTGYSRPHTVHCGPEGLYISTLGGAGPTARRCARHLHHGLREFRDTWQMGDRPRTAETALRLLVEPAARLPGVERVGPAAAIRKRHRRRKSCSPTVTATSVHFWDLRQRRHVQSIDLGANHQMPLEVRPAHDPTREYGFLGVVVDTTNLEGSIWTWWRENGKFHIEKTAIIPPEPADKVLPPLLQGFGAVPPFVRDIDLSLDDRYLYVACWGTGEQRNTMSAIRCSRSSTVRARRRHRMAHKHPNGNPFAAGRKWPKSAATANGSTSPIRSIRAGIRSSIPKACGRDGHGQYRRRRENGTGQGFLGRVSQGLRLASGAAARR